RADLFETLTDGEVVLYRRRGEERPPPAPPRPRRVSAPSVEERREEARPAPPPREATPRLVLSGSYTDGERLSTELRPLLHLAAAGGALEIDLDGASYL